MEQPPAPAKPVPPAYGPGANPYGRAFAIGAVAGLRAFTAPAAVRLERRDRGTLGLALLAAGELVGDKLPATPSRLSPPALGARVVSGALCGRVLAMRFGGAAATGALAGALGAVASALTGYYTRNTLVTRAHVPDFVAALAEDAVAITSGINAQRRPPDVM